MLSVLRWWFCCCWLICLLLLPLWESVIVLCFVVRYYMSILVLQSSWYGREGWLLCLICLLGVSWWLSGYSSRCHGVVWGCDCGISWSYSLTFFVGSNNFSAQFIKIISHYRKIGYNINVLQQTACLWSTQSRLATLLSSLIARQWVGLQSLWRFRPKDLSIDEMVGAWCFGCCQANGGLPVGSLLLRYSVLFTVESLYLLYLLIISWFICSRRWCIDKLVVFHANQTSMCLDPHLNKGWNWCTVKPVSLPVKYIYWPF